MRKLLINGKAPKNTIIGNGFKIPVSDKNMETIKVPGKDGEVPTRVLLEGSDLTIPIVYRNRATNHNASEVRREITEWLSDRKEVEIHIQDTDFYWNGWIMGQSELSITDLGFYEFDITFKLTDPFKYSKTIKKSDFLKNSAVIDNKGTEDTPFVFVGNALETIPYFHIGLHDDNLEESQYSQFIIGDDDDESTVKDYSPPLLIDEFRDSIGYSRMGEHETIPGFLGGMTGASLTQTAETWRLNESTIKQKTGWRGMGYTKQFNRAVSDFKSTWKFNMNTSQGGRSKLGQFLYDENGRIIFAMGYSKTTHPSDNGRLHFFAYKEDGGEVTLWRYNLSAKLKSVKKLVIYLRLIREGDVLKMRMWAFDDADERGRLSHLKLMDANRTFHDRERYYLRKIASAKYGTFRGNVAYRTVSHLGVYMYELLPKPTGASDYIIRQGDEIVFNTKDKYITVNGEPMLHEKDFFSNFFNLKPGISHLAISPLDKIKGHVEYQERWS